MVLLEFAMAPHGQPLQVLSHVTLGIADVLTRPERPLTLLADYRNGSVAPVGAHDQQTFVSLRHRDGGGHDCVAAMEQTSPRAGGQLCPQYLETGRWRRDFSNAWMTASARGREFRMLPREAGPAAYRSSAPDTSINCNGHKAVALETLQLTTCRSLQFVPPRYPGVAATLPTPGPYPAAPFSSPPPLTRTAQYLNSGILPNGSSAALVSRLAAAS